MTAEELLQRYAAGERNFSGIHLWGACLDEAILRRANFNGATLECSMIRTDFTGGFFKGAVLRHSMMEVNLTRCHLNGAELVEVDLSDAILRYARLDGATLSQSLLTGADLTQARLLAAEMDETLMRNTNLHQANLRGASGVNIDVWLEEECIVYARWQYKK